MTMTHDADAATTAADAGAGPVEGDAGDERDVLTAGPTLEEREGRLAAGARSLDNRRSVLGGGNVLLIASGALLTTGLTAILLGWWGAAQSTIVEEQLPYLISGGLLGVALSVVGGVVFFAQWLTILIREDRAREAARARDHRELIDELRSLRAALSAQQAPTRRGRAPRQASAADG